MLPAPMMTSASPGFKIFLTASADVRAMRRYKELTEKGKECDLDQIREDIIRRDKQDSERPIAPLKQAEDAILLDSSDLSIDQVIEAVTGYFDRIRRQEG